MHIKKVHIGYLFSFQRHPINLFHYGCTDNCLTPGGWTYVSFNDEQEIKRPWWKHITLRFHQDMVRSWFFLTFLIG